MALDAKKYEQLSAYIDGELPDAQRDKVERWLAEDAQARRLADELRQVAGMVAALPRGTAGADLADHVIARLERETLLGESQTPANSATRTGWLKPLAIAAALLMAVTVGWLAFPTELEKERNIVQLAENERSIGTADTPRSPPPSREFGEFDSDRIAKKEAVPSPSIESPAIAARPLADVGTGQSLQYEEEGTGLGASAPMAGGIDESKSPARPAPSEERLASSDLESRRQSATEAREHQLQQDPTFIKPPTPQDFETRFAQNQVRGLEIQSAPIAVFDNRLEVEAADPDAVHGLSRMIEADMAGNFVPKLHENDDRPVEPTQAFYCGRSDADRRADLDFENESNQKAAPGDSSDADTSARIYVLNVPRSQAAPLLNSMQNYLVTNQVESQWTANGQPIPAANAAAETLRQLVPSSFQALSASQGEPLGMGGRSPLNPPAGKDSPNALAQGSTRTSAEAASCENDKVAHGEKADSDQDKPDSFREKPDADGDDARKPELPYKGPARRAGKSPRARSGDDAAVADRIKKESTAPRGGLRGRQTAEITPTAQEGGKSEPDFVGPPTAGAEFAGAGHGGVDLDPPAPADEPFVTIAIALRTTQTLKQAAPTAGTSQSNEGSTDQPIDAADNEAARGGRAQPPRAIGGAAPASQPTSQGARRG